MQNKQGSIFLAQSPDDSYQVWGALLFFMVLRFGKYKGYRIEDLPTSYIVYALTEFDNLHVSVKSLLEVELIERIPTIKISAKNIKSTFKKMALKYHPDKGGSTAQMQAINDFYQTLCNLQSNGSN